MQVKRADNHGDVIIRFFIKKRYEPLVHSAFPISLLLYLKIRIHGFFNLTLGIHKRTFRHLRKLRRCL